MKRLLKAIECLFKLTNLLLIISFKIYRLRNIDNFFYIFIEKDDFDVYLL